MAKVTGRLAKELEILKRMKDEDIDFTDIPEKTDWSGAVRGKFYAATESVPDHSHRRRRSRLVQGAGKGIPNAHQRDAARGRRWPNQERAGERPAVWEAADHRVVVFSFEPPEIPDRCSWPR